MKKIITALGIGFMVAGASQAGLVVTNEFSSAETFSTLDNVSSMDLATGLAVERNWTGGNFTATLATDGLLGSGFDNNAPNDKIGDGIFRYKIDLGSAQGIGKVNTYAFSDNGVRCMQTFTLYGSVADTASFDETDGATWVMIASVDTTGATGLSGDTWGVTSIYDDGGAALGTYRELLWVTEPVNWTDRGGYEASIYKEFDVVAVPEPATLGLVVAFGGGILFIRRRLML
ncbi:hypothetical protein PDESU_01572 [Pontiella desulfatans]|uniref:PEP-CTERM protein-sorting domain-containing protein n=1 Tax=Pontiella desulfatans TaxID=2750659 RepID=A0A6C2TZ72_PONDE|nr:PEP-CTERM sorting domain-containing protein [Pontiella desulfatans]VGO13018.1 hypothetical protein PDESU_01572 [Pontiella desulfatans]